MLLLLIYRPYVSYQVYIVVFELFHLRIYDEVKIPSLLVLEREAISDYSQISRRRPDSHSIVNKELVSPLLMIHHAADINSRQCPRTPALVYSLLVPLLFREHDISQAAPWADQIMIEIRFPSEMRFPDCHFLYLLSIVITRPEQQIQGKYHMGQAQKPKFQRSICMCKCASSTPFDQTMPTLRSSVAPMLARLRHVHPRFSVREVAFSNL